MQSLQRENQDVPAGRIVKGDGERFVRITGKLVDPLAFRDIVVMVRNGAPVRVREHGCIFLGERLTLRVVAQHADWWNCDYYAPAEYARKLSVLREHCRAIGRDPEAIVPSCYMGVTVSHDAARLVRVPKQRLHETARKAELIGVVDLVTKAGVLAHPGFFFDFPRESYLVVSLLTPHAVFAEGLDRVLQHLRTLTPGDD